MVATGYGRKHAIHPKDKSAHKAWLEDHCHQLKHKAGAAEALYNEMVALQARKCTQKLPQHLQDKLGAAAITYYKNHRHQMNYITTSVTPSNIFRLARV